MLETLKNEFVQERSSQKNLCHAIRQVFEQYRINCSIIRSFPRFIRQNPALYAAYLHQTEEDISATARDLHELRPVTDIKEARLITAVAYIAVEYAIQDWTEDKTERELMEHMEHMDMSFQRLYAIFSSQR